MDRATHFLATHIGTLVLALGLVAVAGLRISQLSIAEAPPGADGGDWLAFAYQLAGEHVRAADAAAPPVIPVLLWGLLALVPSLLALKIVAVFASIAVAVPLYLIFRPEVQALPAAMLAVAFTMTGYHSETMAWGGYPQLLGVAFLTATLLTLGKGLVNGSRRMLVASGLCAALTLGTHQLAAVTLVLAVPIFVVCLAIQKDSAIRTLRLWRDRVAIWIGSAAVLSLPVVPFYWRILALANGNPANPQGYSLATFTSASDYAFRDEPLLWTVLFVGGAIFCLALVAQRRGSMLSASAVALMLASLLIFVLLSEVRVLYILQVGVFEAVALAVPALFETVRASPYGVVASWGARAALVVALVGLVATLVIRGYDRSQDTMAYYRVVNGATLEALQWLGQNTPPNSIVVAGETQRDGPYSWWVEGISKRPSYSTDLKFLRGYNKGQQDQILYATQLLSSSMSAADEIRLIRARHLQYFFVDKGATQEFNHLELNVPMNVVFENQQIEILSPIGL